MATFLFFVAGVLVLSAVIQGLLATYAPKAYQAMKEDEERRRRRRNEFLKSAVGFGFRWWGK